MSTLSSAEVQSDLMSRARCGDRAAYGQIVLHHQDRLFNALFLLVGDSDEAAELTQETFRRGMAKISQIEGDFEPYPWLLRIGLNLAVISLRKSRRPRAFGAAADAAPADSRTNLQVLQAMGRLDAEYRAVLVLRDVENFDYQRIADVLTLAAPAVKSRLFRARLALWDELRDHLTE
jgi:RNA polymerase sigma-70 factor (ECF subfamily)